MHRILVPFLALGLLAGDGPAAAQDAGVALPAVELDAGAPPPTTDVTITAPASSEVTVTPAAAEPTPTADAPPVVDAAHDIQHGSWRYALSGLLVGLMALLQRSREKIPLFRGQRGGAILVGLLGLLASVSTVLAADVALSPELLLGAVGITWTAVGGWHWLHDVIRPSSVSSTQAVALLGDIDAWIEQSADGVIPQALRARIRAALPKAPAVPS